MSEPDPKTTPSDGSEIDRRSLLTAIAGAISMAAMQGALPSLAFGDERQNSTGYYPPTLTGMRGSHPGSFENAHALRDGRVTLADAERLDEAYDLIVVGGGISGLSAAHFYRHSRPNSRVLILDNHDDFGGHAKRNEMHVDGHMLLLNGGTFLIDSPRPYSAVADGLLRSLDIRPDDLAKRYRESPAFLAQKLGRGVFFGQERFGRDVLLPVPGGKAGYFSGGGTSEQWADALRDAPLSPESKAQIVRIETASVDYFPELDAAKTMDRLSRMSYRDYLKDLVGANEEVLDYYQAVTHGEFGIGIDAEPALDCCGIGLRGFKGLKIDKTNTARMGNTAAGYLSTGGSYNFHFPDGNATVARALVGKLVPAVASSRSIEELVTARFDYGQLDRPGNQTRIRLNATVVNVKRSAEEVEVAYIEDGNLKSLRARHCVLACYNMMIPYLLPELPEVQKAALHQLVKVPLVYTTVALRNWRPFAKAKVASVSCPGEFFSSMMLVPGPQIGRYRGPRSADEPIVLHLVRTPCLPGAPTERDQHRAGRAELLATNLETFEQKARELLNRAFGPHGFDAARDIASITVNRWPHGYAYEYNPLYDPWDVPESARPHVIGRQPFGPIAIANSDSGAAAYTDSAIDQAYRAVNELLG
jgi:spermidine dehydrogenase